MQSRSLDGPRLVNGDILLAASFVVSRNNCKGELDSAIVVTNNYAKSRPVTFKASGGANGKLLEQCRKSAPLSPPRPRRHCGREHERGDHRLRRRQVQLSVPV